jgi:hypothetical protein
MTVAYLQAPRCAVVAPILVSLARLVLLSGPR